MYFNLYCSSVGLFDRHGKTHSFHLRATFPPPGATGSNPAGIEQPGVRFMMRHLIRQHLGVSHRMKCQERLSEARGEGCLRLRHSIFRTCHLRCISRDEMKHHLLRGEFGDGWKNTPSITSEQDDVTGMVG